MNIDDIKLPLFRTSVPAPPAGPSANPVDEVRPGLPTAPSAGSLPVSSAGASSAGAAKCPYLQQQTLGEKLGNPLADKIPCPALRTLANEGMIPVDANGEVQTTDLMKAFHQGLKIDTALTTLLVEGGKSTQTHGLGDLLKTHTINLYALKDGPLMHNGDSGILRHGYNEERMQELLACSGDGQNVTLSDLAHAQKGFLQRDPGERGHTFGTAELTALVTVFGRTNDAGEKFLSKDDLVGLFRDSKLPQGFKPEGVNALQLGTEVYRFAQAQKP
ncbi:MAG TPA: hypothetical protein VGO93_28830 [Candidatus Xenobia bacterium]|jgi:hypothetical protein